MKMTSKLLMVCGWLCLLVSGSAFANHASPPAEPILVIGGSYANGKVPFNDGLTSPLFGIAVNFASYASLGDGFIRRGYYVVNEGQSGATTFARPGCEPGPACGPGVWDSYDTQLQRALARVAYPTGGFNASYVVITVPNDCLHSAAFAVPQSQAIPCTSAEVGDAMQALVDVGSAAIQAGLTPVYVGYPRYEDVDLPLFQQLFAIQWLVTQAQYNEIALQHWTTITSQLPQAVYVAGAWHNFAHLGDGLHPTYETVLRAVWRIERRLGL